MLPTKYQGSRPYGVRQEYFYMFFSILEFKESDVLPGQTEVKQGKYPRQRVILETLINHKHRSYFSNP